MSKNRFIRGISFFLKSDLHRKRKILIVFLLLTRYSFIVSFVPLRLYYWKYFNLESEENLNLKPYSEEITLIKRIGKGIPWKTTCLIECLTLKKLLSKYEVNVPIILGLNIKESMHAHAWCLRSIKNGFIEINRNME